MAHRVNQTCPRRSAGLRSDLLRRASLGSLLSMVLAAPAAAEEARNWNLDDNPEAPALQYGTPDSDDMLLAFTCEPAKKRMTIVESIPSKTLNPGGRATFKLTVGSASLDLTGDA